MCFNWSVLSCTVAPDAAEYKNGRNGASCPPTWDDDGDVSYSVETDAGLKTLQAVNVIRHIFCQIKGDGIACV